MLSVDDYLERVLSLVRPLPPTHMPLLDAVGQVLSEDVTAPRDLPGFDNAAMDGYAVQFADLAPGVELEVLGDIAAGAVASVHLRPGTALRIMTGAPLPAGADTVVPVEHTDGGTNRVRIDSDVALGAHIRRAGDDLAAGVLAVRAGTDITPRSVALLAACDRAGVLVHPRPRVAVISTGDELVVAGRPVGAGQLVDSNGPLLVAALRASGAEARLIGPVRDDAAAFSAALAEAAASSDLIVTSGGVSMGAYDTVKEVLSTAGGVEFAKVAMNPGMPQGCGRALDVPIITLPGNPVSTYVSFELFVRPVLRRLQGRSDHATPTRSAHTTAAISSPLNKRQFARGVVQGHDTLTVTPVQGQGSHAMGGLADANCLIVVPEGVAEVPVGSAVQVIDLR